jgi:hypothetical protein
MRQRGAERPLMKIEQRTNDQRMVWIVYFASIAIIAYFALSAW